MRLCKLRCINAYVRGKKPIAGVGMTAFSVDPEAVRAAATQLEQARDSAPAPRWPGNVEFGHAALQATAGEFTSGTTEVWSNRIEELGEIVSRLRVSADSYEEADAAEVGFDG